MKINPHQHLAYCTNIHPAESWAETFTVLKEDVLAVRDRLFKNHPEKASQSYAIGLRLSAQAAEELLLTEGTLPEFQRWLTQENCYVYTINGFPYGAFHDTRVKENVYRPDWTTKERLMYTGYLFKIISILCPEDSGGSVSTLPGSFKEFDADETLIFSSLYAISRHIEGLVAETGKDLHLGLEPEPLGHFENTEETLAFFARFHHWAEAQGLRTDCLKKHIGLNYDTCHFALEFDDPHHSLQAFADAGIRLSKIHLSNALSFDPQSEAACEAIQAYNEPTYLHQVITQAKDGTLTRYKDLPDFFSSFTTPNSPVTSPSKARCHFHVPLYANPLAPLGSTLDHAEQTLAWLQENPTLCPHLEIETYTYKVLPAELQKPLTEQITDEYEWVFSQL